MKITVKQLRMLIKEVDEGQWAACVYDGEVEAAHWFMKGTKQACQQASQKMAKLVGRKIMSPQQVEASDEFIDGAMMVLPVGDTLIQRTAVTIVQKALGDSYGVNASIMVGYPKLGDDEDQTYFQPVEKTSFKPGDRAIMAVFIGSAPGGWLMVDMGLSRAEHWQEGTISNTSPDPTDESDEEWNRRINSDVADKK